MIWIIAGGRNYRYCPADHAWLNRLVEEIGPPDLVIHGGATGADAFGHYWAGLHDYPVREFPAHWSDQGRAAGPIRNHRMALYVKQAGGGACVLFPGSRGTANMRWEASRAGLRIIERVPAAYPAASRAPQPASDT